MTDKHWQTALAILGVPHTAAVPGAPLASNWRRLRSEFNAIDAGKLLLGNTQGVLEILLQSSKSPNLPPISIVGMGKEAAQQALQARGMSMEQLKQMKFDFHEHVKHGDGRSGQLLNKKYGGYVSDDLTSSKNYVAYARMLQGI